MTPKTHACRSCLVVLFVMLITSLNSSAQATRNLITQPVDEMQLATLAGNIHAGVRAENDQGMVDDSMPLEHVIMLLKPAPEQQHRLAALVDQLHNPKSPLYHQWLTPEQFGEQFGLSESDLTTLVNWMGSHGFTIEDVPPGRNLLIFSGNAGQVREVFHTEIHHYLVHGEAHYANSSEPQVPTALAPVIAGFRSLNDFRPTPLHQDAGVARHDMKTGAWEKVSGPESVPELTFTYGGSQYFYLGPQDFYTIYNENPLFSTSPKIDGHGVTIAVIEETNVAHTSDVTSFRQQFGLPAYPATPNATDGGVNWIIGPGHGCTTVGVTSTGEEGEALLDVEWAGAVAPKAIVDFVACGGGIDVSAEYTTNYLASTVVATSLSYGSCEILDGSSAAAFYTTEWEQEAAEGITAVVSAGDSGSLTCDQDQGTGTHNLSVSELSDTPYNISAGGTDFSDFYQAQSYSAYWNTANSTVPNGSSALSYIPEVTWGSYCASPLFASYLHAVGSTTFGTTYTPEAICNSAESVGGGYVAPVGGGGGVSIYNTLPTWQSAYGVGLAGNQSSTIWRNQPDLSFFASNGFWGHALLYCQSDTGYSCNYSNTSNDRNAAALAAGGTSFVAPQINGMMALIAQQTGARQGVANYTLYNLATLEYGSSSTPNSANLTSCSGSGQAGTAVGANCIFRDIAGDTPNPWQGGTLTTSIVEPCVYSVVTTCYRTLSTDSFGLTSLGDHPATDSPAYPTSQGYDAATGLGSPNIANLVTNWTTATPQFASTITLSADPNTFPTNTSTTLTATVTATGRGESLTAGPPAVGTVNFYIRSTSGTLLGTGTLTQACTGSAPANLVCPPSTATLSVPGTSLALGSNSLVAYFPGDGANDASSTSSAISVTVNPASSAPVAGVSPPSLTFGNQNLGTTSASQAVMLSNTGGTALTIASIVPTANFGESDSCGGIVQPNTICQLNVTFTPTSGGPITGTLTITDNSNFVSGSQQTVSLAGTGIGGSGSLSATSEAFGSQVINTTSATKTVNLNSTGTASLVLSGISITGTNMNDFHETNNCPASLAAGAKCTISLTYTPSVLGAETATLNVAGYGTNSPQTAALTGTGVVPAYLSVTSLAFGNVGENSPSAGKNVTIYNNEAVALSISSITTGNPDFAETNTCNGSVAAKSHCTITVTFTPSVLGAETGTLSVNDAASNSPQTAALTGTGVLPATLSATSLAFGNVGENSPSAAKTITFYNHEAEALTNSSITTSNPDFAETNTCAGSVAAAGHCVITVTFTPSTLAAETGTLSVNDAASNSPQTAALTGTGVLPATLSATSLAFGNVGENIPSAAKTITFYNYEAEALTISSITTGNPDYTETDTCHGSVPAAGHCVITVTFTPSIIGADPGTLTVTDAASNSPQTAALTGTGIAQATVSPTFETFAARTVGTTSPAVTVTLTNNLSTALTFNGVTFGGTNPTDFASPSNTCGTSLAAKAHCTISVTFTPGATGTRTGTMNVNDSANNTPQTVTLTGTGK